MNSAVESTSKETAVSKADIRTHSVFYLTGCFRAGKWVSIFGDWIYWFIVSWYVLSATQSGIQLGILLMIWALPPVLIIPFQSIIALTGGRKSVVVLIGLTRAVVVFGFTGLLANNAFQIWIPYAATAIMAFCGAISHSISCNVFTATKPDEPVQATANKEQTLFDCCAMFGIIAGGVLYDWLGIVSGLRTCAVIYIVAAGLKIIIALVSDRGATAQPRTEPDKFFTELKTGWNYYRTHRWLFHILFFFALSIILLWPYMTIFLPFVFKILLNSGSFTPALIQGSFWAGVIIGYTVISQLGIKGRIRSSISNSYLCIVLILFLATVPLSRIFKPDLTTWSISVIYIMLAIFFGITMASLNIQINTLIGIKLPYNIRKFALAVWRTVVLASIPIGFLIGGYLTAVIPMYWLFMLAALGVLLISIRLGRMMEIREIQPVEGEAALLDQK